MEVGQPRRSVKESGLGKAGQGEARRGKKGGIYSQEQYHSHCGGRLARQAHRR